MLWGEGSIKQFFATGPLIPSYTTGYKRGVYGSADKTGAGFVAWCSTLEETSMDDDNEEDDDGDRTF
jgi:hypothetical protein